MSKLDSLFCIIDALLFIVCIVIYKKLIFLKRKVAFDYVLKYLNKLYFCSYTLAEIHLLDFFPRFHEFVDWGFCAPVAAMSMLALKENRTARFVYAHADTTRFNHCWVEFRLMGVWYVIDPLWTNCLVTSRRKFYKKYEPEILKICSHEQFWSYPVSHDFLRKMSDPQTSWLIWELMVVYGFNEHGDKLFKSNIGTITLDEDEIGRHVNVQLYYYYPEIIFTRRIVHQMMQRPKRTRPKAHTIRKMKTGIKKTGLRFEEWLIEHNQTQLLRANVLAG